MNLHRLVADVLVVVHLGYVSFVVIGLVAVLLGGWLRWAWVRNFCFRVIHLAMIGVVVAESIGGIVCPLTTWEAQLRIAAGEEGQPGSFVGRLVHQLMFFDAPEWAFTLAYCLFGAAVLATFFLVPPRRARMVPKQPPV